MTGGHAWQGCVCDRGACMAGKMANAFLFLILLYFAVTIQEMCTLIQLIRLPAKVWNFELKYKVT